MLKVLRTRVETRESHHGVHGRQDLQGSLRGLRLPAHTSIDLNMGTHSELHKMEDHFHFHLKIFSHYFISTYGTGQTHL